MEDKDIIALWRFYDDSLKQALVLNTKNAEEITKLKVQSFLASMKPIKVFTLIIGILWVGFIDMLLVNLYHVASPFFLISMGVQVLLTKLAIGVYVYQLVLLHGTDVSEPILATQERIARLISSTLWITRLLFLQFPVWTTFYLSMGMLKGSNWWQLVITLGITGVFTWIGVWFFVNIKYENRDKRWFQLIFRGREWTPVMKSRELLGQISEYRDER
ncbi:MAG: hypothetical protein J7621_02065 [Niastella sp.]|nr:hypothetical protein [Niastella sp.]